MLRFTTALLVTVALAAPVAASAQTVNVVRATAGSDTLTGTPGVDAIFGFKGDDTIAGFAGPDRISGGDGDDKLSGGEGNDRLRGGHGADILDGGDGDDRIEGRAGSDTILGGAGDDKIWAKGRGGKTDSIDAGPGQRRRPRARRQRGQDRLCIGEDTVYVDFKDDVAADCEHVLRKAPTRGEQA